MDSTTNHPLTHADIKSTYLEMRHGRAQAAKLLRPGDLVTVGSLLAYAVESVDTSHKDWWHWTVSMVAVAGHSWTHYASQVQRILPGRDTRNLRFGAEESAVWSKARAGYRGPICPECGAAGDAIDSNGQGDYLCTECDTEWRMDGNEVAP
jgi:hypothetical protein